LRNALYAFSAFEAREGLCLVSTEDVYVGKNMRTSVDLAKFIGGIVARVADWDRGGDARWIKAGAWRKVVLGLGHFTKRDIAKRASLEEIPKRVRRLDEFLDAVGREDHCTDAVGIALWRMIEEGIA
jgi:Holliday junction resolvasome RuvABC endonuclease subunit